MDKYIDLNISLPEELFEKLYAHCADMEVNMEVEDFCVKAIIDAIIDLEEKDA